VALITILTAEPRKGKTQAALGLVGPRAVFFVPSALNANPLVNKIPWAYARDVVGVDVPKFQKKHPKARLVLEIGESQLLEHFKGPDWAGYTFVFDDFPQLLPLAEDGRNFLSFIAGIRHREGTVIVTTQRIAGVMPRISRVLADTIIQVGPLMAQDESDVLYVMGGSGAYRTKKEFYQAISTNPDYELFYVKS